MDGANMQGESMVFEKLKLQNKQLLVIDSLEGQVQLNAFRRFLRTGLQPQLEVSHTLIRTAVSFLWPTIVFRITKSL